MSSQEIIDNMGRWISSFSEETPENICALYDDTACLLGTLSPIIRDNAALIREYFEQIFIFSNRHVELIDANVRFYGNVAISNGVYSFNWLKNDVMETIMARFTFVYVHKAGRWLIIEHHSSAIPSG